MTKHRIYKDMSDNQLEHCISETFNEVAESNKEAIVPVITATANLTAFALFALKSPTCIAHAGAAISMGIKAAKILGSAKGARKTLRALKKEKKVRKKENSNKSTNQFTSKMSA